MQKFEIEFFPEICCDFCNDVIHNHFNCPVCLVEGAGTSIYHDTYEEREGDIFSCEECKTEFKITKKEFNKVQVEVVK
jgi:hypothetical protein